MWLLRAIIGVLIFVILLGFFVYNAEQRVSVHIMTTLYHDVPLIVVVFWSFVFGLLTSFLLSITVYFKQASDIRRLKRSAENLNSEITALRNRPIEEAEDKFILPGKEDKQ
ncbi:MAG: LapA family protein [Candidatus Zixiibacteriota bacterium]